MIVLDTNALMMPVECDVRVFEELERVVGGGDYVVPEAVLSELDRLSTGAGEAATAASVGRDLAAEHARALAHEATNADDAVLELGREADYAVTNDGPLKARLLDAGVSVISLRSGNKLAVTQP